MKILLVTDTHGQLTILNDLAKQNSADAIIHAGDFGFFDNTSIERLSEREIRLHIVYSNLDQMEKKNILAQPPATQKKFVRDELPLSDLPCFLSGEKQFEIPVYAVWGNHEDVDVVKKFHTGEYQIEGLHVLHEDNTFHLDNLHIFGLGGNFIMNKKLFQKSIAGSRGKIWSVFSQYLHLLETIKNNALKNEKRILVSHVSSGKEPFITLMGIHTASDLILSGHMDPPISMVWNEFTIRSTEEAINRVQQRLFDIRQIYNSLNVGKNSQYEDAFSFLADLHCGNTSCNQKQEPVWYRSILNLNLPDVPNGYALIEINDDVWKIHSKCENFI